MVSLGLVSLCGWWVSGQWVSGQWVPWCFIKYLVKYCVERYIVEKWSGKMGSGLVSRPLDDLCSWYLDFWWVCVIWWVCSGSGSVNSVSMSFQKMFGLYGLKHQVEIFLMRDRRTREDRATYLLIWNTLRLAMVLFIHLVQNWKCHQVSLVCSSSFQIMLPSLMTPPSELQVSWITSPAVVSEWGDS